MAFLFLWSLMRKFIVILSLVAISIATWAVPATKEPIIRMQADGSCDTVYLFGDEHCSFLGREDAIPAEYHRFRAQAPQRQMLSSYMPSKGTVKVPVLLANFSDLSFSLTDPVAQFDDLFNGAGGSNPSATGSVHTYYAESSHNALDIQYVVYGPYTLSKEMAYYGANTTSQGVTTDHTKHARDLVIELVNLAYQDGVDFSQFDANSDGYIDNISIVVAGHNEAEGGAVNTIWPHYSVVHSGSKYNGKSISGYLMISEYRGGSGKTQAGIGTYCHEFGHALGLPDLYNTETGKKTNVGAWDIMCTGSYNNNGSTPPSFTAFERFMMGWLTPTQITSSGMQVLPPIETHNEAYLIAASNHNLKSLSPNPSEYFLLENRQKVGWDAGKDALIASGLLISHITFNRNGWDYNYFNNSDPLGFAIVSAGFTEATHSSAADIFPGTTMRTFWTPTLNNGTALTQFKVTQIHPRSDSCMSMLIGQVGDLALSFDQDQVEVETPYLNQIVSYDTVQVNLQINHMTQDRVRLFVSSDLFRFSADNGATWHDNTDSALIDVLPDTQYNIPIRVLHTPKRKSCSQVYAFLTAETTDESIMTQVTLAGRAPRPIDISTPVIDSITNISSSSFSIYWEPQDDAELYYYALYTMSEGNIEYIHTLEQYVIYAPGYNIVFRDLQPGTTYYYTMQSFEEKGCEPHYSPLSEPVAIRTRKIDDNPQLIVARDDDGKYTVLLPEMADGLHYITISNPDGQLIRTLRPAYGQTTYVLPPLERGQIYLLKYFSGRMMRKDLSTKILYY